MMLRNKKRYTVMRAGAGRWEDVPIPTGFDWDPGLIIQRRRKHFRVWNPTINKEFDPADYAPAYANTYYVAMDGDDGNAGTQEAPLRRIKTALAKTGTVRVIILDQGPYDNDTGWGGYNLSRSAVVIGHSEGTIVSNHYGSLAFAIDNEIYPNTYHATQAEASAWAFDAKYLDEYGDYSQLSIQTSVADVDANPGSIYINVDEIYIRLVDDRTPDGDVRISKAGTYGDNARFVPTANGTYGLYLENLKLYGGKAGLFTRQADGKTMTVAAKGCEFSYCQTGNGFYAAGTGNVYLLDCRANRNEDDGFNYTFYQNNYCQFIEVNCAARDNGYTNRDDNASTCHASTRGIRVNGNYSRSEGRNIHDIVNAQSWNLGCVSHASKISTGDSTGREANKNFAVGDASGTAAEMWLDSCVSYGSYEDIQVFANAVLRYRDLTSEGNYLIDAAGVMEAY